MPDDRFSYQNLRVYQDMLRSISSAQEIASRWDSVHAIVDHFDRASEGAFVCLAEACRTHQSASRNESVDYSLSSFRLLDRLSRSDFRRIDEAATSIVLNIAEGNGRLSHLDHGRFIEIASRSTTKLAARIELCAVRGGIAQKEADEIIRLLVRVDQTTARLAEYWRTQG